MSLETVLSAAKSGAAGNANLNYFQCIRRFADGTTQVVPIGISLGTLGDFTVIVSFLIPDKGAAKTPVHMHCIILVCQLKKRDIL